FLGNISCGHGVSPVAALFEEEVAIRTLETLRLRGCFRLLLAKQITVLEAAAVSEVSHDITSGVDAIRVRRNGSREIDGNRCALAQHKTMAIGTAVNGSSDNITLRVAINCERLYGSRHIDCRKYSLAQSITMGVTDAVFRESYNIA